MRIAAVLLVCVGLLGCGGSTGTIASTDVKPGFYRGDLIARDSSGRVVDQGTVEATVGTDHRLLLLGIARNGASIFYSSFTLLGQFDDAGFLQRGVLLGISSYTLDPSRYSSVNNRISLDVKFSDENVATYELRFDWSEPLILGTDPIVADGMSSPPPAGKYKGEYRAFYGEQETVFDEFGTAEIVVDSSGCYRSSGLYAPPMNGTFEAGGTVRDASIYAHDYLVQPEGTVYTWNGTHLRITMPRWWANPAHVFIDLDPEH